MGLQREPLPGRLRILKVKFFFQYFSFLPPFPVANLRSPNLHAHPVALGNGLAHPPRLDTKVQNFAIFSAFIIK
jgi:hypothetical protein